MRKRYRISQDEQTQRAEDVRRRAKLALDALSEEEWAALQLLAPAGEERSWWNTHPPGDTLDCIEWAQQHIAWPERLAHPPSITAEEAAKIREELWEP